MQTWREVARILQFGFLGRLTIVTKNRFCACHARTCAGSACEPGGNGAASIAESLSLRRLRRDGGRCTRCSGRMLAALKVRSFEVPRFEDARAAPILILVHPAKAIDGGRGAPRHLPWFVDAWSSLTPLRTCPPTLSRRAWPTHGSRTRGAFPALQSVQRRHMQVR